MKPFWKKSAEARAQARAQQARKKELEAKIAELDGSQDPMDVARVRMYRRFLNRLQSEARA